MYTSWAVAILKPMFAPTKWAGLVTLVIWYFLQMMMGERDVMTISWMYEDIKEIHMRWYQLRDDALEIFLTNGQTLLLAFENAKVRVNKAKNLEIDQVFLWPHVYAMGTQYSSIKMKYV